LPDERVADGCRFGRDPGFADARGRCEPSWPAGPDSSDHTWSIDGIVRAVDRGRGHHLDNLGYSDPIELRRLIDAIAAAPGKTPIIRRLPEQPGDVRQIYAEIGRAAAELDHAPKAPLSKGLARYVEWYQAASSDRGNNDAPGY
jgi:UDP-glucuronate 4-epimerase